MSRAFIDEEHRVILQDESHVAASGCRIFRTGHAEELDADADRGLRVLIQRRVIREKRAIIGSSPSAKMPTLSSAGRSASCEMCAGGDAVRLAETGPLHRLLTTSDARPM